VRNSPSKTQAQDEIAEAIRSALISPNVADYNGEPANVVDALARIADGLFAVATAIREAPQQDEFGQEHDR
jgi:hypothetical protein